LWQGLTNCSFTEAPPSTREYYDANGNYWVDRQQYPSGYQFELMVSNANYAFSYAGDASAHYTLPSSPGIFTVSATHGKACITLEGCTGYVTYGAGSAEVQITSGQVVWCSLTGAGNRVSVRAVADTGWSFGGSNTQDFISRSGTVPFVDTISPEYCQITMTCANVSSYEI